jgi:CRISPR-associated endonuclease/helicase Cas3
MGFIAHAKPSSDGGWHFNDLEDHLRGVARRARENAASFGPDWAYLAGLWHDLGKYQAAFQAYLRCAAGVDPDAHIEGSGGRVTHSTAGAVHAVRHLPAPLGHVLAYLIAGHHAGLGDWHSPESGRGAVKLRLQEGDAEYQDSLAAGIPADILQAAPPAARLNPDNNREGFHLWLRLLFSALVDADFLDTESFMDADKGAGRSGWPSLSALGAALDRHLAGLSADTPVNRIRAKVLKDCRSAATAEPGLFSLTVPTGGGKTLSSLAFALDHARAHGKRRVIYAIPYTSIIEQTADVFRRALGEDTVLEHHSNLSPEPERENARSRLAAENWDAPLIVTTNVQLFESLFASRTSRCRKLHNLVNSVIVLDEAQQLPREFLAPIVSVMRLLSEHYGVTWLLCTATQPNLGKQRDGFGRTSFAGLPNVREIVPDPNALAEDMRRTEVHLPPAGAPSTPWAELADQLRDEPCVLTIVNTRQDCRVLFRAVEDGDAVHLSALMCAQHRSEAIAGIKARLQARRDGDQRPLRVISTQLVEAGVDLDFPVVYRAMAGLDSIAQAAGRCNREGRLPEPGRVVVFEPEREPPPGLLRQGAAITRELREQIGGDPLAPAVFEQYFRLLYAKGDLDGQRILELLTPPGSGTDPLAVSFRTAAERFRLIDQPQVSVIVPYRGHDQDESPVHEWLRLLEADGSQRWIYRRLQRYTVGLPKRVVERLVPPGYVRAVAGQYLLSDSLYDPVVGVTMPDEFRPADAFFF